MNGHHRTRCASGALLLTILLAPGCGPGEAVEPASEAQSPGPEVIELPSHRRLAGFLPEAHSGHPAVAIESESNVGAGDSIARGRYQGPAGDTLMLAELSISFSGKRLFDKHRRQFDSGAGDRKQVAGFEALVSDDETFGGARVQLLVRVAPQLWVEVRTQGSFEEARALAEAIDLAGLSASLADRTLFEETEDDRLARSILPADQLAALLPERLGTLERASVNAHAALRRNPLHSAASAHYGGGTLTFRDYGDARVAESIVLSARSLKHFAPHVRADDEGAVEERPLELASGRGTWAVLSVDAPRLSVIGVHVVRGRFVAEYVAPYVPELDIDESVPESVRRELARGHQEMGAGAFDSVEAQRDAIVAAIQARLSQPDEN